MADESSPQTAAAMDPTRSDPRELMQKLLPAARTQYIKAWELLADAATPRDRRTAVRAAATKTAADVAAVTTLLRAREASLAGSDLEDVRHLAEQLERLGDGFEKLASLSVVGVSQSEALRPDALGCGKRFRQPAPPDHDMASRSASGVPAVDSRRSPGRQRDADKPFTDRGPKVPRDLLGTSKHPSTLADDLDEDTRAKLEAMRQQLDEGQ